MKSFQFGQHLLILLIFYLIQINGDDDINDNITPVVEGLENLEITQNDKFCGLNEPDPTKTCVSIRLPWRDEPIYFCEDKSKIKYQKNPCGSSYQYCQNWQNNSLLVQTPWDYRCGDVQCVTPPFNRTCHIIESEPEDTYTYNNLNSKCCPRYFCEENTKPSDCPFKKLHSYCSATPPEGKKCIAFKDTFGCCPKFQCEGDRKPGLCPMEKVALKYQDNSTEVENEPNGFSNGGDGKISKKFRPSFALRKFVSGVYPYYDTGPNIPCIGDYNCPGKMICCSKNVNAYSDGKFIAKNNKIQDGYCTDPTKIDKE